MSMMAYNTSLQAHPAKKGEKILSHNRCKLALIEAVLSFALQLVSLSSVSHAPDTVRIETEAPSQPNERTDDDDDDDDEDDDDDGRKRGNMHTASLPVLWVRMIPLFQLIFFHFISFVGKVDHSVNEFTPCMVTIWHAGSSSERGSQIWTSSERYLSHDKSRVLFAVCSHCFVCFRERTLRTDDKWAICSEPWG